MARGMSDHRMVRDLLKYAQVERERRFLIAVLPDGVTGSVRIEDRYLCGTRLRLRQVTYDDGTVVRKLNHKVRLADGPAEIACTSMYLDDNEWDLLGELPSRALQKVRHLIEHDGHRVAVDEFADGTLLAEITSEDSSPPSVPAWLPVVREVTHDEGWTGGERVR